MESIRTYEDDEIGVRIEEGESKIKIESKNSNNDNYFKYTNEERWTLMTEKEVTVPKRKNENIQISKNVRDTDIVIGNSYQDKPLEIHLPDNKLNRVEMWRNHQEPNLIENIEKNNKTEIKNGVLRVNNIIKGEKYTVCIEFEEKTISITGMGEKNIARLDEYLEETKIEIITPDINKPGYITVIHNSNNSVPDTIIELEKDGKRTHKIEQSIDRIERDISEINESTHAETIDAVMLEIDEYSPIVKKIDSTTLEFHKDELMELAEIQFDVKDDFEDIMDLYNISAQVVKEDIQNILGEEIKNKLQSEQSFSAQGVAINAFLFRRDKFQNNYFNFRTKGITECIPQLELSIEIESEYIGDKTEIDNLVKLEPGEKRNINLSIPNKESWIDIDIYIKSEQRDDFIVELNDRAFQHRAGNKEEYSLKRGDTIIIRASSYLLVEKIDLSKKIVMDNIYIDYDAQFP